MCLAAGRRLRVRSGQPPTPWVRMLLPVIGVTGGIAWGATGDPMYLALGLLAGAVAWSVLPATLD